MQTIEGICILTTINVTETKYVFITTINATFGYPSTNNGNESTNAIIKKNTL